MATPWNPIASVTSHEFLWPILTPSFRASTAPKNPSFNRQDLQLVFGADDSAETLRSILEERFFVMKNLAFFSLEEVTWWWLYGDLMNISWCFKWGFIVTWWDCIVIFHGVGQGVKLPQVELEVSKHIYCLGLPWFTTILINDKGCIAHVYSRACFCGPFLVHQKNWLIQMASF